MVAGTIVESPIRAAVVRIVGIAEGDGSVLPRRMLNIAQPSPGNCRPSAGPRTKTGKDDAGNEG